LLLRCFRRPICPWRRWVLVWRRFASGFWWRQDCSGCSVASRPFRRRKQKNDRRDPAIIFFKCHPLYYATRNSGARSCATDQVCRLFALATGYHRITLSIEVSTSNLSNSFDRVGENHLLELKVFIPFLARKNFDRFSWDFSGPSTPALPPAFLVCRHRRMFY
jgi:hypothetical protein